MREKKERRGAGHCRSLPLGLSRLRSGGPGSREGAGMGRGERGERKVINNFKVMKV